MTPDEGDLRAWAAGYFRKSGLQISGRALALFLEYTGEDMQNIAGEAEELCCYCMGMKEVTEQSIRDVTSPRIKDRIFVCAQNRAAGHPESDAKTVRSARQDPGVIRPDA